LRQIEKLRNAGNLRPVNNIKTYGNDLGQHGGGTHNGIQSFIRSTLFGSAAVRFHRPQSGLGLGDTAQVVLQSIRMATDRIDFFHAEPHNELLTDREENEAYCRAVPGKDYLVYFPDAGSVDLDVDSSGSGLKVDQLEILTGQLTMLKIDEREGIVRLKSPGKHFIFIVQIPTQH
jgi:hypothetical protein